jgi:hypothetical protein
MDRIEHHVHAYLPRHSGTSLHQPNHPTFEAFIPNPYPITYVHLPPAQYAPLPCFVPLSLEWLKLTVL